MIVAPTEPPALRAIGRVGTMGETRFGADVVWRSRGRWVGVQRKELRDLVSSVADGRLGQQLAMMAALDVAVLLIEGQPRFTLDGEMTGQWGRGMTLKQYRGVQWTAMARGVWVCGTKDLEDTIAWIGDFKAWCAKDRHMSLMKRDGPYNSWGTPGNDDFARHLLMGLPGVGSEIATRIVEKFGGVPWKWDVTREELLAVEGLGAKKVDRLMAALAGGKVEGDG